LVFVFSLGFLVSGTAQVLDSVNQAAAPAQTNMAAIQGQSSNLVVGSEQDFPPFATGMTDATAGGFTVDLWKAVAAEAGLNYSIRVRPFHQLLQEFKAGQIDVLINLAQSDERHKFAVFTVSHVVVHGAIFVRKGRSDISSEDDLAGKSIIVLNGDLAHDYAVTKGWTQQLVLVETAAEGLRLLASGQHDAMLLSKLTGMKTLQELGLTNVEALKAEAGFSQKFAFATHRGAIDLLAKLNEGLALTKSDGTYNALYEKWFGVYEVKELGLRDLLKYIIPLVASFLLVAGYLFYRRQVERNQVQAVVAESRNLLMTVIDTAPVRVFWKDRNSRYLGCNLLFAQDAGKAHPRDLIGKDDFQLPWAEQAESFRADDQVVMETGSAKLSFDELQMMPTGQTIWVRKSKVPLKSKDSEVIGMLGIYEDITDRKKAEEAVTAAARYARSLIESSLDPLVTISAQGKITDVNSATEQVTGVARARLIGSDFADYFTDPQQAREGYRQVFSQGFVTDYPLAIRHLSGRVTDVLYNASVYHDGDGHVLGVFAAARDVTERQRATEALRQSERELKEAQGLANIGNWQWDLKTGEHFWSEQIFIIYGRDPHAPAASYPQVQSYFTAESWALLRTAVENCLADGSPYECDAEVVRPDGTDRWVVVFGEAVKNQDGNIVKLRGTVQDITDRKQAQQKLNDLNRDFVAFLENTSDFVYFKDEKSRFRFCSQTLANITGHASWRDMIGKHDLEVFPPETAQIYHEEEIPIFQEGKPLLNRIDPYFDAAGRKGWVSTNKWPLLDQEKKVVGLFGISHDIAEQKRMEEKLVESEAYLQAIIRNEPECIKIVDQQGRLKQMNPAGLAMIEADSLEQVLGMPVLDLVAPNYRDAYADLHKRVIDGNPLLLEFEVVGLKGGRRWMETHAVPMQDHGETVHLAVTRDITQRKLLEEHMLQLAFHDTLTNLPNRRLLTDRLKQTMIASKRSGRYAALIFLDLDNFKPLNDLHGHEAGDLLLIEVANRLKACVRGVDTVARFGGDEFVVLLSDLNADQTTSKSQAAIVAEKVRIKLAQPYLLSSKHGPRANSIIEHHCTASIGVVVFFDHEASDDDILKWADDAMYRAKEDGRNRVRFMRQS
jgi:diguanylate cyclase (GGDEF)-like protein/PAS domain S-box-containing protein